MTLLRLATAILTAALLSCGGEGATPESAQPPPPVETPVARAQELIERVRSDEDPDLERELLDALVLGPDEASMAPVFLYHLSDPSPEVRLVSAAALVRLKRHLDSAVPTLLELAEDGGFANAALTGLGEAGAEAVPVLVEELGKGTWNRRMNVATILVDMGAEGRDAVLSLLAEPGRRSLALEAFLKANRSAMPPPEAVIPALKDEQSVVRWKAVRVLRKLRAGSPEEIEALIAALTDETDLVRQEAANTLAAAAATAEAAVPALVGAAADPESNVRVAAIEALGKVCVGSEEVVAALVRALGEAAGTQMAYESARVRVAAAKALALLDPPPQAALPALRARFEDEHPWVRTEAALAVLSVGGPAEKAVAVLSRRLAIFGDWGIGGGVLMRLARLRRPDPAVIGLLRECLCSADDQLRRSALDGLEGTGAAAAPFIPELVRLLDAARHGLRRTASEVLAGVGEEAGPALESVLEGGEPVAGLNAAYALWRIRGAAGPGMGAILGALDSEDPVTRHEALNIVIRLGPDAAEAVPRLGRLLEQGRDRNFVLWALERMGGHAEPSIPAIVGCLEDEDPGVRVTAAEALGFLGRVARDAVPALREVMRSDADGFVRLAAKEAVEAIEK